MSVRQMVFDKRSCYHFRHIELVSKLMDKTWAEFSSPDVDVHVYALQHILDINA